VTDEQRKTFAKGFIAFIGIVLGDGGMKSSSFAAMLAVTLGRFIHDYFPPATRHRLALLCAQSLVRVAVEDDDDETESVH